MSLLRCSEVVGHKVLHRLFGEDFYTMLYGNWRINHHRAIEPKTVKDLMRKQSFFLAYVFLFFGYNGTPLRPQNRKTSVQK